MDIIGNLNFFNIFKYSDEIKIHEKLNTAVNETSGDEEWLVCAVCSNRITNISNKIKINSSHEHTFTNPHGLLFNILCFNNAIGCIESGFSTNEFTWFQGYSWQIVLCSSCRVHLGWKYTKGDAYFYGLIKDLLIIEKKESM